MLRNFVRTTKTLGLCRFGSLSYAQVIMPGFFAGFFSYRFR